MAMKVEIMALPASFYDSGVEGIRMVSVFFGRAPLLRRVVEVKNIAECKAQFESMVAESKALDVPFSLRIRQIGGRAVNGWAKARFAYDHEPDVTSY